MIKRTIVLLFIISGIVTAQNSLEHYLRKGIEHAPSLIEYENLREINSIQDGLNSAENSAFKVFLSADYLFAPYFNNNGQLLSTNPDQNAYGYDIGITNGGLYSAQLNIEKNVFNGGVLDALQNQNKVLAERYKFNYDFEKHNLEKQITEQYLTAYKSFLIYDLSKENVANLTEQLNITADLVKNGYEKAQNYLLLKIGLQNEQINLNEVLQNYKNDLVQLNTICGINDTNVVILNQTELNLSSTKTGSDFLKQYDLDSLNLIDQQLVFETKYLPQLKLFFNTGLNAVETNGIERKFGLSAGFSFSLPLFDGGQKNLTWQQNQISQNTISNYRRHFELSLDMMLYNTLSRIKSLKQNLHELNEQIGEYQNLIAISREGLQKGNISMIEYLTLLKNFIDLKKSEIEKQINYQMEINNYNYWNW